MALIGEHNYSYVFHFEKNFDEPSFLKFMLERWTDSFIYSAMYVLVIFATQMYMKERPSYGLRPALAVWSGLLAVFSIIGAIRTVPELYTVLKNHGYQYSICVPTYFVGPTGFWCCLFTVSKVFELGDTIFIVLRKQQLIFLHWYHHITVLLYVWYSYASHTAAGRWFMVMNFTVHSFMYTYYACRAMRINFPRYVNVVITSLQLVQMTVGCIVNISVYRVKGRGEYCQQSDENLKYSSLMYLSYFILFAQFFYNTYIDKKMRAKKTA